MNSFAVVFVDGKKAGEIRFPAGEVDLTAVCRPGGKHVLSLLVVALPLKGVLLSYTDTNSAREVKGTVERRGLCGDVYLAGTPSAARIADVKIDTSVRKGEITVSAALDGLAADAAYTLRVEIRTEDRVVRQFTSKAFKAGDLKDGRIAVTEKWKPEKLWDVHTPQNTLHRPGFAARGRRTSSWTLPARALRVPRVLDRRPGLLPQRHAHLPLRRAAGQRPDRGAVGDLRGARETMKRLQSFGINFVYTHNYGCEPGSHVSFAEILRAADDVGMLVAFSQPHFSHYDWKAADADRTNGYARHAEFYVRAAQNHPSVVAYSMSHNATGYDEDMNPDLIDGLKDPRTDSWSQNNAKLALRAEAIVKKLRPGPHRLPPLVGQPRLDAHDEFLSELRADPGAVRLVRALGRRRASSRSSCASTACRSPGTGRCTAAGTRASGNGAAPGCRGSSASPSGTPSSSATGPSGSASRRRRTSAGRPEQFRAGNLWHRWDYPYPVGSSVFDDRQEVLARYLTDNWRAHPHLGSLRQFAVGIRVFLEAARRRWTGDARNSRWTGTTCKSRGSARTTPQPRQGSMSMDGERDGLDPDGGGAGAAPQQPAAAGLHRRQAGPLHEQGPQLPPRRNGRKAAHRHQQFAGNRVVRLRVVAGPAPACRPAARSSPFATGEQERIPLRFDLPAALPAGNYELTATRPLRQRRDAEGLLHHPRPAARRPTLRDGEDRPVRPEGRDRPSCWPA